MRKLIGTVVSDTMDKTVVVKVVMTKEHAKYSRAFKVSRRFKAHDENNEYKVGDTVMLEETRPLSRDKRWRAVKLVSRDTAPKGE